MPLPRWIPHLPRSRRGWLLAAGGTTIVVLAGGFAFVYFVLLGTSSPAPLTLNSSASSGTPVPAPALTQSQFAGT